MVFRVLFVLLCIFLVLKWDTKPEINEGYACIAREYVKIQEEDETVYEPIQIPCGGLEDDMCKKMKADCVHIDIDEELFEDDEDEESTTLLKMYESCMKKDTFVKMDMACTKRISGNRGRGGRIPNLSKCILKNKIDKYYFDDKCDLV